jgi:hypothetical protein
VEAQGQAVALGSLAILALGSAIADMVCIACDYRIEDSPNASLLGGWGNSIAADLNDLTCRTALTYDVGQGG